MEKYQRFLGIGAFPGFALGGVVRHAAKGRCDGMASKARGNKHNIIFLALYTGSWFRVFIFRLGNCLVRGGWFSPKPNDLSQIVFIFGN
jgi:hypothetical protein